MPSRYRFTITAQSPQEYAYIVALAEEHEWAYIADGDKIHIVSDQIMNILIVVGTVWRNTV